MHILMVLTSHAALGRSGRPTGFWLEELAAPYCVFEDAGAQVRLASPQGGLPPVDPASLLPAAQTDATRRFQADPQAQEALAHSARLARMHAVDFDAVFYPGGHGPMWDLVDDEASLAFIRAMLAQGKPVAAVCHASAVLARVKDAEGQPIVRGQHVTGFSNEEEAAGGLAAELPFLVQDLLQAQGGDYTHAAPWQPHVVVDGLLVTGQNPASSGPAALRLLERLRDGA